MGILVTAPFKCYRLTVKPCLQKEECCVGRELSKSQAVDAVGTPHTTHVLESVCVGYTCKIHPDGHWSVGKGAGAGLV